MLKSHADQFGALFPYAMVQPTLFNRYEYKVVVLNGIARYITMEPKRVSSQSLILMPV